MKRRIFIESLGASTLLAGAVPVWGTKPWLRSSQAAEAQATGATHEREFFYRPVGAWAADFIPFYDDGRFHLFYLHDWRDMPDTERARPGTRSAPATSSTSPNTAKCWREEPKMSKISTSSPDRSSRRKAAITYFTSGIIPTSRKQGKPVEGIMHAVSDDLLNWKKLPDEMILCSPGKL